ncbi:WGR domain-containing protein [Nostoc sp. ChiQUE01b]|uniref:WGR domain-containing protein n=1 Tax=Nostoc sp. ChiQUE01b TaxID=3075376 RepID=UPI002AD27D40|nr:WGR domain-containing protein [Nostoc sp. ChiQUE01b]MDZ8262964.1 WGR domain-containing protein [Nostoc sp. ChiQUE01b]
MLEQTVYQLDLWQQSKWRRDTRFYTLTLCQNLFGQWVITKTWGSVVKRGFGRSQDLNCSDYQTALTNYHKLQQRREKRGYKRFDSKSRWLYSPTQSTSSQPQHRENKLSLGQLSLF